MWLITMSMLVSVELWSQAGPGGGTAPTEDTSQSTEDALAARERALQLSQQISQINNSYNDQESSLNSQIAQAKLQRAQCTTAYNDAKNSANTQAEQAKQGALQNLMSSMMGPASQMLGNQANSSLKDDKSNFENLATQLNTQDLPEINQYLPRINLSQYTISTDPKTAENQPMPNYQSLKSKCMNPGELSNPQAALHSGTSTQSGGLNSLDVASRSCTDAVNAAQQKFQQAQQYAKRVKEGNNATMSTLATTAIIGGAGLWGYNTTKKGAEDAKNAAIAGAKDSKEVCQDGLDQNISDLEKQLATLGDRRDEEIAFAREAAALAEDYANLNSNIANGTDPSTGLPINPGSLNSNDNLLLSGAKIGDPQLPPSEGPNGSDNGNSNSANPANVAGGGGGAPGGGGAGDANPPNWTFGSPYPSNVGGGGLPEQPGGANYVAEGGGGGSFFGFNSPEDALASFDPNGFGEGEGATRGEAGSGDGGLMTLMRRARQRLTAHAAELLAPTNINTVARKDPQPNAPDSKRKAASLSRL